MEHVEEERKIRTDQQRKCMYGWLDSVATTLNDGGFDMKKTLKPSADIPWTRASAKVFLWDTIQEWLTSMGSSTEITTKECILISEVITRHLGEKLGVTLPPWPTQQNGGGKE